MATIRVIYEPAVGESVSGIWTYLPAAAVWVVDALVPDSFSTAGTIHYKTGVTALAEAHVHAYAGWSE